MDTFGARLRSERESRGLTLEAVASALGVDDGRLRLLENGDFTALPDHTVVVEWLRAYAACLEVDAGLMIEDYERERAGCLRRLETVMTDRVAARPVTATSSAPRREPAPRRWLGGAMIVMALGLVGVWRMLSRDAGEEQAAVEPAVESPARVEAPPAPLVAPAAPSVAETTEAAPPARLHVPEHGVGTAVRNRQLVGAADRFDEGEQVWFWTRIEGGQAGERIEHVWLRDGAEVRRIALVLGGSSWRTFSVKTLGPGSAGAWVVEARDASGAVLAHRAFACVP